MISDNLCPTGQTPTREDHAKISDMDVDEGEAGQSFEQEMIVSCLFVSIRIFANISDIAERVKESARVLY